ncbi:MAG: hypothetical protein GY917_27140, partial [Planctomycetaceae bacterium]|nr:hypothetical protein [Planctomycetaceae bacterium]
LTFNTGDGASIASTNGTLDVTSDQRLEGDETVNLAIGSLSSNLDGQVTIADSTHTATITDDETGVINFATASSSFNPEAVGTVVVDVDLNLVTVGSGTIGLDRTITVDVDDAGTGTATKGATTNDDFTYTNTTLTFSPSDGTSFSDDVTVTVADDIVDEGNETIILATSINSDGTGGQASIVAPAQHTITITDNDTASGVAEFSPATAGVYSMVLSGANLQILQGVTIVTQTLLADVNALVFNGTGGDDTFQVDFSGGNPVPAGGITVHGAGQTGSGDTLDLVNVPGTFTTHTYNYTNANDGNVVLNNGSADFTINYTGLEPVTNDGTANDVIFNLPGTTDSTIALSNVGGGIARLASTVPTFEQTDFAYPAAGGSVTVNLGANDQVITVSSLALNANTDLIIDGEAGSDTINLNVSGGLSVTDDLTLSAETIDQSALVNVLGDATLDAGATGTIDLSIFNNNFQGDVTITNADTADIDDIDGITFAGVTTQGNLGVDTDGPVDFSGTITIGGSLGVDAAGDVTDAATAILNVTNKASFNGANISLGDTGTDTFNAGTLSFDTPGAAVIREDSGTNIVDSNTANSLDLDSTGDITDATATSVTITGLADVAGTSIALGGGTFNVGTLT